MMMMQNRKRGLVLTRTLMVWVAGAMLGWVLALVTVYSAARFGDAGVMNSLFAPVVSIMSEDNSRVAANERRQTRGLRSRSRLSGGATR